MKSLFKSFFLTFIITITSGVLLLIFMNNNNFNNFEKDIQVQTNIEKNIEEKIKRPAIKDDILNILQVINVKNKTIISGILIDPVKKDIKINIFSSLQKTSYYQKNIEELYNYGGVKLLFKTINKDFNKYFNKYLVIKNQDDLIYILDILGSLRIKDEFFEFLKKYIDIKNQIIDPECFLDLINYNNDDITKKLIKELIKQKIVLFNTLPGEDIFKKIINRVESNISYMDFNNLTEIELDKFK